MASQEEQLPSVVCLIERRGWLVGWLVIKSANTRAIAPGFMPAVHVMWYNPEGQKLRRSVRPYLGAIVSQLITQLQTLPLFELSLTCGTAIEMPQPPFQVPIKGERPHHPQTFSHTEWAQVKIFYNLHFSNGTDQHCARGWIPREVSWIWSEVLVRFSLKWGDSKGNGVSHWQPSQLFPITWSIKSCHLQADEERSDCSCRGFCITLRDLCRLLDPLKCQPAPN